MSTLPPSEPLEAEQVKALSPIKRWRLATSVKDVEILEVLAEDPDAEIIESVALNQHTPPYILDRIARQPSVWGKIAVAKSPNSDRETLVYLSAAVEPSVRREVAANRRTPLKVLVRLAEDSEQVVRHMLVTNPVLPDEAMMVLVMDKDGEIRQAVTDACQDNLEALMVLLEDEYASIQERAKNHINRMGDFLFRKQADQLWGEFVENIPASYIRKLIVIGQLKVDVKKHV